MMGTKTKREAVSWTRDGLEQSWRNFRARGASVSAIDDTTRCRQAPLHGRVTGDVWHKTVRRSVHQLRKPPAWAVDLADLERAERYGIVWLELYETEQGVTYRASLQTVREHGQVFDYGYGQQILLPLEHWQADEPEPKAVQGVLAL